MVISETRGAQRGSRERYATVTVFEQPALANRDKAVCVSPAQPFIFHLKRINHSNR
jgi:hypothetical protein